MLTGEGHASFLRDHKAGNGAEVVICDLHRKEFLNLTDFNAAEDLVSAVINRHDFFHFLAADVFIFDLADDFLEDVFHRDQAGDAAVFIDHNGHINMRLLHFAQQLIDRLGFRHCIERPHEFDDRRVSFAHRQARK